MGNEKNAKRAKSRSRKRTFRSNQHTKTKSDSPNKSEPPIIDSEPQCSSAKKLKPLSPQKGQDDFSKGNAFILMDTGLLFEFLSTHIRCEECQQFSLRCEVSTTSQCGFSHNIDLLCSNCTAYRISFKTSGDSCEGEIKHKHKEVNMRMIAFTRSIGKGHNALEKFSLYLNSPPPMSYTSYRSAFRKLHQATREVAAESMKQAAQELKPRTEIDSPMEYSVLMDGTWQKRGHASHHGVVTAISIDNGKCLDVEVLSNICKGCQKWESREGTAEYNAWKVTHNCKINHSGSAGAMEAVGSVRIFGRSENTRNLRYTSYLGDGDSASYKKVVESNPYVDTEVEKLECVGHVQKRCGTRFRRLKNENKGVKLEDGKGLGGVGRLTDKKVDTLQNYYGLAIRKNAGNLKQMISDVRAILPHVGSTDKNPMHDNCPDGEDSWCKFKQDPTSYKHKNGLPDAVIKFIRPVFDSLADEELLTKCLHGRTQNANECLNKLIWDRCAKEVYVEKDVIEEATYSAVAYFNDASRSILNVLKRLGYGGVHTSSMCRRKDLKRISASQQKSSQPAIQRRKKLRAIKKGFIDKAEAVEGDVYTPGGH